MQDNKQPTKPIPSAGSLVPDIVKQIPLATPDNKLRPIDEDDELDKLMQDVSQDVKKVGQKKPKHHWFNKQKKPKAEPEFSARPIEQVKPAPVAPPTPESSAAGQPVQAPVTAKSVQPARVKPVKTSHAPVGAVVIAMVMTVILITAAYFAYK